MKRFAPIPVIALALLIGGNAWAGAYEDGLAALGGGDHATAVKKYREAGLQGDARAQLDLGVMYDTGKGVKKITRKPSSGTDWRHHRGSPSPITISA